MPILKLSYHHLPQRLRQCFAYCSLIPKDKIFQVSKLTRGWLALGFIQPLTGDEELEDVAYEYFMDLVWRSFLECHKMDGLRSSDISHFRMHDLMHDLACSVAGTDYCIANSEAENFYERTRHVSFENYLDSSWEIPRTLLEATKLRSIVFEHGDSSLSPSVGSALVSNFKYIRMLDLCGSGLRTLPHSIGELNHLRDLDLSSNEFRELPSSLCRLQNLHTFDLSYCEELQNLPTKTTRLVNLMHLDIAGCESLGYMPLGLGQLTCLRKLSKFVVGERGKGVGGLRELKGLNNLKGHLEVSCLENAEFPGPGSAYLKDKLNLKSLTLKWRRSDGREIVFDRLQPYPDLEGVNVLHCSEREISSWLSSIKSLSEMVIECLQPHPNLERPEVFHYPGREISSWLSSITNLTELRFEDCSKCKHLPPLNQLSFLKKLTLKELEALENVSETEMHEDLSSAKFETTFFPSLEELWISKCPKLKGWWKAAGRGVGEARNALLPCFPCLSSLDISDCPNLTCMPLFPSVRYLNLTKTWCKQLIQPIREMQSFRTTSESSSSFHPFSNLETLYLRDVEDPVHLPSLRALR